MGFLLLLVLSLLALAAGACAADRWGGELPAAERAVAAGVSGLFLVLLPLEVLGALGWLYPWSAACCEAALALALLGVAGQPAARLRRVLRAWSASAAGALRSPSAALLSGASALLLAYLAAYVVLIPSWGWDALTYHDTIIGYAFQNHGLSWVDTHGAMSPMVNGYPRNVELLGLWLGLFPRDDRLIDGAQLFPLALGVLSVAGLARRAGGSAPVSWSLGLVFLWLPAVFLNAPSNYNDIAVGALWLCAVLLCTAERPAALPFAAVAVGLTMGAKITGLPLAALAGAPLLVQCLRGSRGAGVRVAWRGLGALTLVLLAGGFSYARNAIHTGNPFWPASQLPFGIHLPGPWALEHVDPPPFGGQNDWRAMWRSWGEPTPLWLVDTRSGGFGPAFPMALLPLGVAGLLTLGVRSVRARRLGAAAAALLLVLSGWLNPYRWWARFTYGFAAAAAVGAAVLLSLPRRLWQRELLVGALGLFVLVSAWPARAGFFGPRLPASAWWDELRAAWGKTPEERVAPVYDHWTPQALALRDRLVRPGEASIYDDSVTFIYPLWRPDWKNRVLYRPLTGAPEAWLRALDEDRATWAEVRRGSLAERALYEHGWNLLYPCPIDACDVWGRLR